MASVFPVIRLSATIRAPSVVGRLVDARGMARDYIITLLRPAARGAECPIVSDRPFPLFPFPWMEDDKMRCWMMWHGGSSYGAGTIPDDLETFDSIADAVSAFRSRAEIFDPYYPCVYSDTVEDGGPSAWLFLAFPDGRDPYPDRVIEYGPRGGCIVSRT